MKIKKISRFIFIILSNSAFINAAYSDDGFSFSKNLILGNSDNFENIVSSNYIKDGDYDFDIYINGQFVENQHINIRNIKGNSIPLFSVNQINNIGILPQIKLNNNERYSIKEVNKNVRFEMVPNNFKINIFAPGIDTIRKPIGYVNRKDITYGNSMLFTNYMLNYYNSNTNNKNYSNLFGTFDLGFNFKMFEFRQQSSYNYSGGSNKTKSEFNVLRSYVKVPILAINSNLSLGEIYTSADNFDSLSFNGVKIETDERMISSSLRGYAPLIKGVATSNATVSVYQQNNNVKIYQTTVPSGPFEINDLYSSGYKGNLIVKVVESNGYTHQFIVNSNYLPSSLREGAFRYNFSAGKVKNYSNINTQFSDLNLKYGLNNLITLDSSLRVAEDYLAFGFQNIFSTEYGAFGLSAGYSKSKVNEISQNGGKFGLDYSKDIDYTNTNISIAGYRYMTEGYRNLNDVFGSRSYYKRYKDDSDWTSSTSNRRNEFSLVVNQPLKDNYGNIYISTSINDYYNGKSRETQYQIGYNNYYKKLNYNISFSRSQYVFSDNVISTSQNNNMFTISFSLPLGESNNAPLLTTSYSNSDGQQGYQSSLSGVADDNRSLSYNVTANYDTENKNVYSGIYLNKRNNFNNLNGSISHTSGSTQVSAGATGSLVAHSGGITLGQRLGDTFALIESKGAEGAMVNNRDDTVINSSGYAIMPSLIPYQYNDIGLDTSNIADNNIELIENNKKIAPYSGSSVKVEFKTRFGYPVLINTTNGDFSIGENVLDENNKIIGNVGQGDQIYVRTEKRKGFIKLKDKNDQNCIIYYNLKNEDLNKPIILINGECKK